MRNYNEIRQLYSSVGVPSHLLEQWASPEHDLHALCEKIVERKPKRILEVGTFVGFATLMLAELSPPDAIVHTVDPNLPIASEMGSLRSITDTIDPKLRTQELALKAAKQAGLDRKIVFHPGGFSTGSTYASLNADGSHSVQAIGAAVCEQYGPFDFIFIDGLHYSDAVQTDLALASAYLTPGGVIALDDTLDLRWGPHVRDGLFRFLEKRSDFIFYQKRDWRPMVDIGFLEHFPEGKKDLQIETLYEDDFYRRCIEMHSQVIPHLAREIYNRNHPKSVIDLGCGAGMWLSAFEQCGVKTIRGLEGSLDGVDTAHASVPGRVTPHDLREPFVTDTRYDLCLCLDVIEHIDPQYEDNVIASCVGASDTVIFSSPPPGQGGDGHVNERPIAHWAEKFFQHGYVLEDNLRPHFEGMTHLPETTYQLNLYTARKVFDPQMGLSSEQATVLLKEKERRIEAQFLQSLFQNREIEELRYQLSQAVSERKHVMSEEVFAGMDMTEFVIPFSEIGHERGESYIYPFKSDLGRIFARVAKNDEFILFEDGVPLKKGNCSHDDIRTQGAGLYSLWNNEIYFSSSDHSDPRTNKKVYSCRVPSAVHEAELG